MSLEVRSSIKEYKSMDLEEVGIQTLNLKVADSLPHILILESGENFP